MVGMSTTPTKNADSPNGSMNGSIELDQDLGQDRQQRRRDEQDDDRDGRPLQAGPAWPAGSPWPPRVCVRVRELVDERQDVADDQDDRRRGPTPRSASPGRRSRVVSAKTAGTNSPISGQTSSAAFEPAIRWR